MPGAFLARGTASLAAPSARHTTLKPDPHAADLNCETLEKLVCLHYYEAAQRLHAHLVSAGLPIRPHPAYAAAALHALSRPAHTDRMNLFSTWFRLVPAADPALDLRPLQHALLRTGTPARNLPLITRFATLAAHKGYAPRVWPEVLALLVHHAPPSYAASAILAHERAAAAHAPAERPRLRTHAVRAALAADNPALAAALLRAAPVPPLAARLYDRALAALARRGGAAALRAALRAAHARRPRREHRLALPGGLPMQLREVRAAVRARALHTYLNVPACLVAYRRARPAGRALAVLRARALRRADATARAWLRAELYLWRHALDGRRALAVFLSNFTFAGFSAQARALVGEAARAHGIRRAEPCLARPLSLPPQDQWLVWHAMTLLTWKHPARFRRLLAAYEAHAATLGPAALAASGARQVLLGFMSGFARQISMRGRGASIPSSCLDAPRPDTSLPSPSPSPPPSGSALSPSPPSHALTNLQYVWHLMARLDLAPRRAHYELVARTVALAGDVPGALRVLEGAPRAGRESASRAGRESAPRAGRESASRAGRKGASPVGRDSASRAGREDDIGVASAPLGAASYAMVIEGLLARGMVGAAVEVKQAMEARFGPVGAGRDVGSRTEGRDEGKRTQRGQGKRAQRGQGSKQAGDRTGANHAANAGKEYEDPRLQATMARLEEKMGEALAGFAAQRPRMRTKGAFSSAGGESPRKK
ncbi:hypothetical protein HDZ31DRAFT_73511 [Schizophyllum fasciatum]